MDRRGFLWNAGAGAIGLTLTNRVPGANVSPGGQLKINQVRLLNVTGGEQTRRSAIYVQIDTAGGQRRG